jgi:ribonuclease HI
MVNIHGYFDGACEPRNPGGNMGIGACLYIEKEEVFQHSKFVKASFQNSNNVAEYMGFIAIMDFLLQEKNFQQIAGNVIHVYGDSKLVINQMAGVWGMNGGRYVPYANEARKKMRELEAQHFKFILQWIPREKNFYADELSKAELINHNVQFKIQPHAK